MRDGELTRLLATWFGCGRFPVAPGTAGALGAVPLHALLSLLPAPAHGLAVAAVTAVAVWAAGAAARDAGEEDPPWVVIDEVAGALVALGLVRGEGWLPGAGAFVLFRLLDIVKPGPIRRAERARPPGLGIVLDDLLAGALAGAVTLAAARVVSS